MRNIYHHDDLMKRSKGDQAGSRARVRDLGQERLRPQTGRPVHPEHASSLILSFLPVSKAFGGGFWEAAPDPAEGSPVFGPAG